MCITHSSIFPYSSIYAIYFPPTTGRRHELWNIYLFIEKFAIDLVNVLRSVIHLHLHAFNLQSWQFLMSDFNASWDSPQVVQSLFDFDFFICRKQSEDKFSPWPMTIDHIRVNHDYDYWFICILHRMPGHISQLNTLLFTCFWNSFAHKICQI